MFATKFVFLMLLIISAFFYILYIPDFALVLLILFIALPVIMFIADIILKHSITTEISVRDTNVPKNQPFPVQICITNKSFIPVGRAEAHIEYYNVFSNQISSFYLTLPIQPRNSQRITFQLSSKFCGIIKIRTVNIKISDPIRLFTFRTAKNIRTEVAVIPEIHEIEGTVTTADRVNEESCVFSEHKSGDDPSEVFNLREYNPGDRLNRIHWKLSSKRDDFIVKEYSLPVDVPSAIFLNLKCYEDSEFTLPVFDTLVETFFSVSQLMIENERTHKVIFYSGKQKQFVEKVISSADDLAEVIREIIVSFNDNLYCLTPDVYMIENSVISLSSFTFISSLPDPAVFSSIDECVDSEIKNALIIVKSKTTDASSLCSYPDINVIPVAAGKISSSIKDIEL